VPQALLSRISPTISSEEKSGLGMGPGMVCNDYFGFEAELDCSLKDYLKLKAIKKTYRVSFLPHKYWV